MTIQELAENAFQAGFDCCRGYGDNHIHFRGEQRDRVMAKHLGDLLAAFAPAPVAPPAQESERNRHAVAFDALPPSPAAPSPSDVEQAKARLAASIREAVDLTARGGIGYGRVEEMNTADAIDALIVAVRQEQAERILQLEAELEVANGEVVAVETKLKKQAAEIERLTGCLRRANAQAEDYERRFYLTQDRAERAEAALSLPPSDVLARPEIVQAIEKLNNIIGEYGSALIEEGCGTEECVRMDAALDDLLALVLQHAARPAQETASNVAHGQKTPDRVSGFAASLMREKGQP